MLMEITITDTTRDDAPAYRLQCQSVRITRNTAILRDVRPASVTPVNEMLNRHDLAVLGDFKRCLDKNDGAILLTLPDWGIDVN